MTSRNKKTIMLAVATLLVVLAVVIYIRNREETRQAMVDLDKFSYATVLAFDFRIMLRGHAFRDGGTVLSYINPASDRFDPFYDEFVFVRNEAESVDFPDNVVVAWPREHVYENVIGALHRAVNRDGHELARRGIDRSVLYLEDFGLSYPLTVDDLIDNWENVFALFNAFSPREYSGIINARNHGTPVE